jgi:hypothetical protein
MSQHGDSNASRNCDFLQAGSKDINKVDALFDAYRQENDDVDVIGPEGERDWCD